MLYASNRFCTVLALRLSGQTRLVCAVGFLSTCTWPADALP